MYILACDERGTVFRFSRSQSWVYGGFIFELENRNILISTWKSIKETLCQNPNQELKWSHFFVDSADNPLSNKNNIENQISWALKTMFDSKCIVTPISVRVAKDKASEVCFKTTSKENQVVDYEVLSVAIYAQFALFLKMVHGCGEIWLDQLGSKKEQERKQDSWSKLRNNNPNLQHSELIKKINQRILFFDSKNEPIIQIADFISGAIWAASEGEEKYLLDNLESYFPFWWSKINLVTVI